MVMGWCGVVASLVILTCFAHLMSVTVWLLMSISVQGFMMLSDVPADGYSVGERKVESD